MNYRQNDLGSSKDQLNPWCIIRQLPDMRSKLIIRFHRRNDAEAHLKILKSNNPSATYEVIFDVMPEYSDLAVK
jgi:hypothetical protein